MEVYICDRCAKEFVLIEDLEEAYCPYCGYYDIYDKVEE